MAVDLDFQRRVDPDRQRVLALRVQHLEARTGRRAAQVVQRLVEFAHARRAEVKQPLRAHAAALATAALALALPQA